MSTNCFTCGQDWENETKHDCPMKGKLDAAEEMVVCALLLATGCDHYCCDLTPAACQAKAITHFLREHEMLKEPVESPSSSQVTPDFVEMPITAEESEKEVASWFEHDKELGGKP